MKHLILLCILSTCLTSCTYGQRSNNPSILKVNTAMYAIERMYVDTVNSNKLAEDAIVAMLEKLDPHSNYLTPDEVKEMNEPLQGNFDGIGVQFNMLTDTLYIVQVVPGGPSEKVGILAGDRIIMVDDTLIAGVKMKTTDVMKRLRGPKGTTVNIKILRNKQPKLIDFKIVRDKIPIYSLDASYMINDETGYIKLNRFAATTYEEFIKALKELQAKGMKNLILDLQWNGGGYLNASIEIANEFLKRNSLIVYTEGVHQKREDALANNKGSFENGRLIVLVNESSASASEIVSGAIQDWDRGLIVGRRTFGKGLVQRPVPLPDGSMIRLTTARYFTPSGRSIQKPYENGTESYNKEVIDRYNHGEMITADSIHFPDSLKYNTLVNKRIVYGGGGIMPDYFVPLDTTKYTPFYRELNALGITNKIAMSLIENNRNTYKERYKTLDSFISSFKIGDQVYNNILDQYKKDKTKDKEASEGEDKEEPAPLITPEQLKEFDLAKPIIDLSMKALIARDLWGENEYFQIINADNDALQKAIRIINDSQEYNKLLEK